MVFVKKETEVQKLIDQHFSLVGQTLAELEKMVHAYLKDDKEFKEDCSNIDRLEHEADQVRRDVECKLYQGAFLPIFREDYIMLVEQLDQVANQAEAVSQFIVLTRPTVPEMIQEDLRRIAAVSIEAFKTIKECMVAVRKKPEEAFEVSKTVQVKEKEVDDVVWGMTKKLFKSDIAKAEKIHVKMLIDRIAAISNRIEDTADRLAIMAVKSKV
jgi:predicted phosphate transport protein (TIGR00153 family)